jgi:sarcosine oxidase
VVVPGTDVIVVGLGAMGSSVCLQLAQRGASVVGIDQYEPPHVYGSTHGDTRMTRLAPGEGPEYVPLVHRSHELWRELERQAGVALLTQPGGLVLAEADNPFLARTRAAAEAFEVAHESLSGAQVAERFPMFAVDSDTVAYHEPGSGYVRPERALTAQLALARRHGAVLRLSERVSAWSADGSGVRVCTDAAVHTADRLVLCAGPWIPELFPAGRDIFAIHRQVFYWFPIRRGHVQLRDMPVFVWEFGGERDAFTHLRGFYGFPAIDGADGGLKVGTEVYETTTTPDGRQHPPSRAEITAMYEEYIAPRLPWLGPDPVRTMSCLYTNAADNRFLIDRHPDHDAVFVVSPCSGHGFKHSPAIGEAVAQWILDGASELDLGPFALARAVRRPAGRDGPAGALRDAPTGA